MWFGTLFADTISSDIAHNNLKIYKIMEQELKKEFIYSVEDVNKILDTPTREVQLFSNCNLSRIAGFELNKVFYVVYEGCLRQMRIIRLITLPFNNGYKKANGFSIRNIAYIEVAGVGDMYVQSDMFCYTFPFYIYESVQAFLDGKPYELSVKNLQEADIKNIYKSICDFDYNGYAVCYRWDGLYAKAVNVELPIYFSYSPEMGVVIPMDEEEYPESVDEGLYVSIEDCKKDNSVNVCRFDEKKEEDKEMEQRYDINIFGVPMTATKEELLNIQKQISNII